MTAYGGRLKRVPAAILVLVALLSACSGSSSSKSAVVTTTSATTTTRPIPRYREAVFTDVTVTKDVTYGSAPGVDATPESLKLDLYQPKGDRAKDVFRPAIVFVHGGGYAAGDKGFGPSAEMAPLFARLGYVTVSINYRLLAPNGCSAGGGQSTSVCQAAAIEAIHDGQAAVRWLRTEAISDRYRIDRTRIGIAGESAGAITAVGVGVAWDTPGNSGHPFEPSSVQAWMSLSGGLPGGIFVDSRDAPGLLISGTADPIVPYTWSAQTKDAMEKVKLPVELITYEGAGHVPWAEHKAEIEKRTIAFFYEHIVQHPIEWHVAPGVDAPLTITSGAAAPTCRQASKGTDLGAFVSAFLADRMRGGGAEACLTPAALARYCSPARTCTKLDFERDPGPICLYDCQGEKIATFDTSGGSAKVADGAYSLHLMVDFSVGRHQNEAIDLETVDGGLRITGASTSA